MSEDRMAWGAPDWNEGGIAMLTIAVTLDEDTELDPWCWRVGRSGPLEPIEDRAKSRLAAILAAFSAALEAEVQS